MKFAVSMSGTPGRMAFGGRGRGVIGSRKEAKTPRKPVTVVSCRVASGNGLGEVVDFADKSDKSDLF